MLKRIINKLKNNEVTTDKSKKKQPGVNEKNVFINMDMQRKDPLFPDFKAKLTAREKIDHMFAQYKIAYEQVIKLEPDATSIVITGREYSLTDIGDAKSIDKEAKQYMIDQYKELIDQCPKMVVLTAPALIRSKKKIAKKEKIEAYYERLAPLSRLEPDDEYRQVNKHILFNKKLVRNISPYRETFDAVSNKSYLLTPKMDKKKKPISQTKLGVYLEQAPYEFSMNNSPKSPIKKSPNLEAVYSPGKKDIEFIVLPSGLKIYMYICRDFLLLPQLEEKQKTNIRAKDADIQLVLADSSPLFLNHLVSNNILYFDSDFPAEHVVTDPEKTKEGAVPDVIVYNFNVLDSQAVAKKLVPYCPLVFTYSHFIKENIPTLVDLLSASTQLKKLDEAIKGALPSDSIPDYYTYKKLFSIITDFQSGNSNLEVQLLIHDIAMLIVNDLAHYPYNHERKILLKLYDANAALKNIFGVALKMNDTAIIKKCIERGIEVDIKDIPALDNVVSVEQKSESSETSTTSLEFSMSPRRSM